jgi:hypothetical protein
MGETNPIPELPRGHLVWNPPDRHPVDSVEVARSEHGYTLSYTRHGVTYSATTEDLSELLTCVRDLFTEGP